jgi:uncharacterized protein
MERKQLISKLSDIVESACKKESNQFGYGIWSHHIVVVMKYAKLLAKKLGANLEIVEIAALLHDYAGIKNIDYHEEHHIYGAKEAEKILKSYNYPKEKVEKVKRCILSHRGSIEAKKETVEEVCLASADAMAHIDQVVSLLHMVYDKKDMDIDEGKKWVRNKLKRSWNKLNQEAKEIVEGKYYAALKVLE